MEKRDVIIIGSGPAGLTAAIYTARANLKPLVFEGLQPGGQLTITTDVTNFPGFPEGVMGPDMMELFKKQAENFGTECVWKSVIQADLSERPFKLKDDSGEEYLAKTLIIATGATARQLGLKSEKKLIGYGVSGCATCDGFFFKDKELIVVGGGDTAIEDAVYLTRFASKVTIVHRRDELRASKIMRQKAFGNPKIEFKWDSVVTEIMGDQKTGVKGVKLRNVKSDEITDFACNGVFVAIGHKPNTDMFKGQLKMDDVGYLITNGKSSKTDIPGVFVCGDAQDPVYRQAITAAGSGCMAAIDAERFLEEMG
ncbi:MAG: thioredoxin-disulfide reductase [Candidatus Cloacimonetes bacterium 4572_55]|nr:MAG: thioredoxin-disulfide reductase [Candidatus Cloacimonetes bacterium 4572_55]